MFKRPTASGDVLTKVINPVFTVKLGVLLNLNIHSAKMKMFIFMVKLCNKLLSLPAPETQVTYHPLTTP